MALRRPSMPKMPQLPTWATKTFAYGQNVVGLLPSSVSGVVMGWLAILAGYGPLAAGLCFLLTAAAVEIILWRARSRNALWGSLAALALFIVGILAWGIIDAQRKANAYGLKNVYITVLRDGYTLLTGENRVNRIQVAMRFVTKDDTPLYIKIQRAYASIYGKNTPLTYKGAQVALLQPGYAREFNTDYVKGDFENGKHHQGEFEFIILYGKSSDKLDRRYTYRGKFQFFLQPLSAYLGQQPSVSEESETNERIEPAP